MFISCNCRMPKPPSAFGRHTISHATTPECLVELEFQRHKLFKQFDSAGRKRKSHCHIGWDTTQNMFELARQMRAT